MKLDAMPVLKSIYEYGRSGVIPFHMPGHKRGNIFRKLGIQLSDFDILTMDTTEVPGVDNLHCPEHAIIEAQQRAAEVFGAQYTFFLANGTTCGIYSMILAVTNPEDRIIIPRNCHRSVTGAVILGRLVPVYIEPEVDPQLGVAMGITPETVEEALLKHPDAKAVVITNPTFYGTCSALDKIADVVHKHGKLLLVDEAHGSHFGFHKDLPDAALQAGADLVAQSTHKTLTAMTQGSMLHVKSDKVDLDKLKFYLQLTQSTSPSHVILASLDVARYIMEQKGEELLQAVIEESKLARNRLNRIPGVYCIDEERIGRYGIADIDPTRLTVNFRGCGLLGSEAERILRDSFKIQVEMSDLYNIVAITTIGDEIENYQSFVEAVAALAKMGSSSKRTGLEDFAGMSYYHKLPEVACLPWEAVHMKRELADLETALGKVCGEMIVPYPPGIPVIMPGERIDRELVDYLKACCAADLKVNGMDKAAKTISVLK